MVVGEEARSNQMIWGSFVFRFRAAKDNYMVLAKSLRERMIATSSMYELILNT